MSGAPIPPLSPAQKWALERMPDDRPGRRPSGVDGRVLKRLEELGLAILKRERGRHRATILQTWCKRTPRGREALGLPPLETNGDS